MVASSVASWSIVSACFLATVIAASRLTNNKNNEKDLTKRRTHSVDEDNKSDIFLLEENISFPCWHNTYQSWGFCLSPQECSQAFNQTEFELRGKILMPENVFILGNKDSLDCLHSFKNELLSGICCHKNTNVKDSIPMEKESVPFQHIHLEKSGRTFMDRGHLFFRPIKTEGDFSYYQEPNKVRKDEEEQPKKPENTNWSSQTHPPFITHVHDLTNKPWWVRSTDSTTSKPWWATSTVSTSSKPLWATSTVSTTSKPWWATSTVSTTSKYWWATSTVSTTSKPWWVTSSVTTTQKPWWGHSTDETTRIPPWKRTTSSETSESWSVTAPSIESSTASSSHLSVRKYCSPTFYSNQNKMETFRSTESRITGGRPLSPHSFPWLAVIFLEEKHVCGGSLIDDVHVLTAAHCVAGLNSRELKRMVIVFGSHNIHRIEDTRQDFSVKRAVRHRDYDNILLYNDIGIITLNRPVIFTSAVSPICLYTGQDSLVNQLGTVAGWGSQYEGGSQMDTPRKVALRIWSNDECRDTYGHAAPGGIVESYMCAGKYGRDACSGDSGGPIVMQEDGIWKQIGIVSWGIGCGKAHYPGVYSRMSHYLPWIDMVTAKF